MYKNLQESQAVSLKDAVNTKGIYAVEPFHYGRVRTRSDETLHHSYRPDKHTGETEYDITMHLII